MSNIPYNKIQDDIMFLARNAILRMNVILYPKSEKYGRRLYYSEIEYEDNITNSPTRKIMRSFDYYLSIENIKPIEGTEEKEFIIVRDKDLELMYHFLYPKLLKMMQSNDTWEKRKDNKLYLKKNIKPVQIEMSSMGKFLVFEPGITVLLDNNEQIPCINLYLNSKSNMVKIPFGNIYSLLNIIRTFQIQIYASSMVNFVGRPVDGTNLYKSKFIGIGNEGVTSPNKPRILPCQKKKTQSFFNK